MTNRYAIQRKLMAERAYIVRARFSHGFAVHDLSFPSDMIGQPRPLSSMLVESVRDLMSAIIRDDVAAITEIHAGVMWWRVLDDVISIDATKDGELLQIELEPQTPDGVKP